MTYLRDNPTFRHLVLLVREEALWLVPDGTGRWTLPGFDGDEQHTAEVGEVGRQLRARYGARVAILGTVASDFDEPANRVRQVYLAEALTGPTADGRWWSRHAVAAGGAPLRDDVGELVSRWARGELGAGEAAWSRPGWLAEALAWVEARAGSIADFEQVRVSEFSALVRAVAGGRARYFKAVAPGAAREPPVTAALARRTPRVPPVIAVDDRRRFLLMEAFAGAPLASDDLVVWAAVAAALGELQRSCVEAVDELRALGCDLAPATALVEPISALLADPDALLVGEPAGLTGDEVASLRALAPALVERARELDAGPLPPTVDHGDLWPSNVLVGPGGCAFVDWEDVRVAHPFVTPFQLLAGAHMDRRFADEAAAHAVIRETYLAGWDAFAPRGVLRRAFEIAHDVAAVAVAASYRRQPPAVIAGHPWMREMPAFCLRRILERRKSETPLRDREAGSQG